MSKFNVPIVAKLSGLLEMWLQMIYASAVLAMALCLSLCLSVCPSVRHKSAFY